jgi:hypothetical protein
MDNEAAITPSARYPIARCVSDGLSHLDYVNIGKDLASWSAMRADPLTVRLSVLVVVQYFTLESTVPIC